MRHLCLVLALLILGAPALADPVRSYAVEVSARVQASPPRIDFTWTIDLDASEYYVFRKLEPDSVWGPPIAHLDGTATSFADEDVAVGAAYEYSFQKTLGFHAVTVSVAGGTAVTFTIYDQWGDGMCCMHGLGSYEVTGCGTTYASGGAFGSSESTAFTTGACDELIVAITLDVWGAETSWVLTEDATGATLAQGGPYASPHFGHIFAGIEVPPIEEGGTVLLLIEESLAAPVAYELGRLERDLICEGYRVRRHLVASDDEVPAVKDLILNESAADPDLQTIFLLGHVPVPYSGNERGVHSDHQGAWPADVYYAELDGVWTDSVVYNTSASRPENHNVPGDGKFDQTFPPSDVDLQIGRVDLSRMPAFPEDEAALMRRYLDKNHTFRSGAVTIAPRGLVEDNVGEAGGLAFAAFGWRSFATMFGADSVFAGDYFPDLEHASYLWAYGCGPSGYTNCGGVGSTYDFANRNVFCVFTILYGSYFGDWDNENNVLRAPLGANGFPLVCFYAGRPTWNVQHMSLGYPIGYSTRLNQNNINLYTAADGSNQIHIGIMGDPTLKMFIVQPPEDLHASADTAGEVTLNWRASNGASHGYHVYRAAGLRERFARINAVPVDDTTFVDSDPLPGSNVYMVRALKLDARASGSFFNLSIGVLDSLSVASAAEPELGTHPLMSRPNPFLRATLIRYQVPRAMHVAIQIHDVAGALIRTLVNGELAAGEHRFSWDGSNAAGRGVPSGLYFCTATTIGFRSAERIIKLD